MRRLIDKLYRETRGLSSGIDPEITSAELFALVLDRVFERVRGIARGLPRTYMGRRVRLKCRGKLDIGAKTVIGSFVAMECMSRKGISIGSQSTIDQSAVLRASGVIRNLGEGIVIGHRTSIGAYNVILGQGGVYIGDDCLLGPHVTVVSENHVFDKPEVAIRDQGEVREATRIGNNVWIGAGAIVLAGATIGDGAVIAAGAVVRGDVPEGTVVGGVPARVLRVRAQS